MKEMEGEGSTIIGVDRRRALAICAIGCLGPTIMSSIAFADSEELPTKGDHLVSGDGDEKSPPLTVDSVKVGGDIVTAIAVTASGIAKSSSRFAKLILLRFDPKDLDDSAKPMAADGVLAFSAICTHQGCELSVWEPSTDKLKCFCHGSEFLPEKAGQVAHGPAVKQLPMLPLVKGEGGKLMVADGFTAPPGPPPKATL